MIYNFDLFLNQTKSFLFICEVFSSSSFLIEIEREIDCWLFIAVYIVVIAVVTYNSILNSIMNNGNSSCQLSFKERIKPSRLLMIG